MVALPFYFPEPLSPFRDERHLSSFFSLFPSQLPGLARVGPVRRSSRGWIRAEPSRRRRPNEHEVRREGASVVTLSSRRVAREPLAR